MARAYNFNAGPAALPEEVLREAAADMLDFGGSGISVMEMSHRSKQFKSIIETAEADLRELAGIPQNYKVLFLQGGGTQQFAAVPMNLCGNGVFDYVVTGTWSKKAFKEAKMYGDAAAIASGEEGGFTAIPDCSDLPVRADADYVYICENETVNGIAFCELPDTKGRPLVSDVSSCLLAGPVDVARYGLMWGGVQKNVGPAGCTLVVVRDDLVREDVWPGTPTILRYKTQADAGSLYNTPPCWSIYVCGLVFKWLKRQGGLEAVGAANRAKAARLHDYLDASALFRGRAERGSRSIMNVTFSTGDESLDASFIDAATKAGFVGIKGHRSVGGMRASLYNAVPLAAVDALVEFMNAFEKENGGRASRPSCSQSS